MISRHVIRIECEPTAPDTLRCVDDGAVPGFVRGEAVEFQFALFKDKSARTLDDISGISAVFLKVFQSTATGTCLITSTDASAVVKTGTPTITTWEDAASYHFSVFFPSSLTAIAAGTHFLSFYAVPVDDAASLVALAYGSLTVTDAGLTSSTSPTPGAGTTATEEFIKNYLAQTLGDYLHRVGAPGETFVITGPDGTKAELVPEGGEIKWNITPP